MIKTIDLDLLKYNTYFNKPYFIKGIGNVYPISVNDYRDFLTVFNKYFFSISLQGFKNLKIVPKDYEGSKFDVVIELFLQDSICMTEISKLFEKILKQELVYDSIDRCFVVKNTLEDYCINASNFDEFIEVIMLQNVIHEKIIAPNKMSQMMYEKEIERLTKGDKPTDFLSVCAVVDMHVMSDVMQFPYFKLRYCYELIMREFKNSIEISKIGVVDGKDINLEPVGQSVKLEENPYDINRLRKKHTVSKTI